MDANALKGRIALFCEFANKNYVEKNFSQARYREEVEFAEALAVFRTLTQSERENIRASVNDPYDAYYFADFAVRQASFAVQTGDSEQLRQGAVALTIDADVMDPRALFGALGVSNEAANRLGVDLFQKIMAPLLGSATRDRRKLIKDFFFHPDSVKSIEKLGYELISIEGAPWFRRRPV